MSAAPDVTVVIPCRDREATVAAAALSVLSQEGPSLEVVAVDDGSGDGTLAVLAEIDDPRLRVLRNPGPPGVSAARNHGAAQGRGRWIAFQDSDDLWLPGKLAAQAARLSEPGTVAVYCGMTVARDADPDAPVEARIPDRALAPLEGDILPALLRDSFVSTQTLMLTRDAFETAGGFDETLHALVDWELMLRVAPLGRVAFVDEDLVVQRMSPNSITRSRRRRLEAQLHVLERHAALFARDPAALARHHDRLAGGHRLLGEHAAAARHAARAARLAPGPRSLAKTVVLSGRALLCR